MSQRLQRNAPCPCQSGRKAKRCCLTPSGWLYKQPARLRGDHEPTGHSNPRCYARPLADCCTELSREHYFSKGILRRFEDLRIAGPPWAPVGQPKPVGVEALTARILCTRHNNRLSSLDQAGLNLFDALDRYLGELTDDPPNAGPRHILVSGEDLQRLLLKMLVGICVSGNARLASTGEPLRWTPPERWLHLLFCDAPWVPGTGLHLQAGQGQRVRYFRHLQFEVVARAHDRDVVGGLCSISGYVFLLAVEPAVKLDPHRYGTFQPNPGTIMLDRCKTIEISWPQEVQPYHLRQRVGEWEPRDHAVPPSWKPSTR